MEYETIKLTHRIAVEVFTTGMTLCLIALLIYGGRSMSRRREVLRLVRSILFNITSLAYLVVMGLGLWMVYLGGWYTSLWFWAKMLFAFMIIGWVHGVMSKQLRLAAREEEYSIPLSIKISLPIFLVAVAAITYLVLFKPF